MDGFIKTIRKVKRLPHKLKKKLKRKLKRKPRQRRASDFATSGKPTISKSPVRNVEVSTVSKNENHGRKLIVKSSDIDIGVDLNTTISTNNGADEMNKAKYPPESTSSTSDHVRQHELDTKQQSLKEKSSQHTQSKRSLHSTYSKASEHRMRRNSQKSCTCTKTEIHPCQWDANMMVHLTDLVYTQSRIWGRVLVSNVNYEKRIFVRWSQDNWESYSEQEANYKGKSSSSEIDGDKDAFTFEILRPQDGKTVEFAVRYCVCDEEFWDNNEGTNYQVTGNVTQ